MYDKTGKLMGQASFTEELSKELSSGLTNSINQLLLQQQFGEMIEMLNSISDDVRHVLIGQQNDRIGECASAEQQLIEALKINNTDLRRSMLANSIQTVENSRGKLGCGQTRVYIKSSTENPTSRNLCKCFE